MLPRELRKAQWLEIPCKGLRALFLNKRNINALFNFQLLGGISTYAGSVYRQFKINDPPVSHTIATKCMCNGIIAYREVKEATSPKQRVVVRERE